MNTIFLHIKLLNGNMFITPMKRVMCGCPRHGDVLIFKTDTEPTVHAKVNKVRWFLDEGIVRIHAVELKPEERDS